MSSAEVRIKENLPKRAYPNILVVPETDEHTDYKSYLGLVKPGFKDLVKKHLDIVNRADFNHLETGQKTKAEQIKELLNRAWYWYESALGSSWPSQDAINDVFTYLRDRQIAHQPNVLGSGDYRSGIKELETYFTEQLSSSSGQTVVLSETHATTTPLVRVLKAANPDARIGMFVFDTHLDTDPESAIPRKSNVLRHLVEGDKKGHEPVVERMSVIGVPYKTEVDYRGSSWGVERFQGKINIISEDDLMGSDPHNLSFSKKALNEIILRELAKMKGAGITNVMVSVDLDVLKSAVLGLTAFEYSAFHSLLFLAKLRDLPVYQDLPGMIYHLLTKVGKFPEEDTSILDYPITLGGRGLSVPYVQHALSSIRTASQSLGMEFGIRFGNAQVLGDIVELSGPDYGDKTKSAALQIAQSMSA